jgi:Cu/Ag efflux pump CusA
VVSDAVVDPDRLARRLHAARAKSSDPEAANPAWATVVYGSAETRRALFYAVLISAAATVPVFFLQGEGGAFLPDIMLSYLLAVAASMLVAVTLTPVLGLMLLGRASRHAANAPWLRRVGRGYGSVAPRLVTKTGLALGVAAVLAVAGAASLPFLDTSMRPLLKEQDILVHLEAAPGTSLPKMTEITKQAVDDLGGLSGVVNVGGQVGRAIASDQIVNVNSGEVWVKVSPDADYDRAVAAIEDTVRGYQGVSSDVLTYSEERVTDILGRSSEDLVVRVYGENPEVLDQKADEIQRALAGVDGVAKANVERALDEPTVTVKVDLERAQAAGVKPGDVRRAAATLMGGMTVGNLFEQQKVFDVVVWGTPEIRQSEANIENLLVDTPSGGQIRIGEVADVQIVQSPTVIRHESVATYLDVTADVAGRDVAGVAGQVDEIVKGMEFPLEHHAELLGGYEERVAEQTTLIGVGIAVLITIYLLMQAALRSWRLATLAFATLPLGVAGGLVAALLTGGTLTLGSIAGLIAVVGLAARAVVPLIRRYQELERVEGMAFGPELVVRGTGEGMASTMIALLGTAVLFIPVAVSGGSGLEIVQPMAVVILGGIVATMLATLLVVPILYAKYGLVTNRDDWAEDLMEPASPEPAQARTASPSVMQRIRLAFLAVPLALTASACGGPIADAYTIAHEPASVQTVAGSEHPRVVLEEKAAQRLAIETGVVSRQGSGLVVPSSAVFVDPEGKWWVYTNPEPLAYERAEITVAREAGGNAYLTKGPAAGTKVVTVGVPEIYGVEDAVGH